MSAIYILPEEPIADFHARITRSGQARTLNARRNRKAAFKRIGVLAAALAVPALATPGGLNSPAKQAAAAPVVEPMGFEIAGESFPGSAFYYLEDIPQLLPDSSGQSLQLAHATANAGAPDLAAYTRVQGAAPLLIAGSGSDYARAKLCMTQAIYYEAASESDAGQRAVAQVVLNRVAHPTFPNTVCGVVFQGSQRSTGCQFSFTCDGSMARKPSAIFWTRADRIARQALAGSVYAPVGHATHYHTLAVNPHWAPSLDPITVIGAHQFYTWRGKAGRAGAFTARYRGAEPLTQGQTISPSPALAQLPISPLELANPDLAAPSGVPAHPNMQATSTASAAARPAADAPAPNRLPTGGGVRSEYAQSGQWREGVGMR